MNKKLIVFLDNIGRTIIAPLVSETNDTITVSNPSTTQLVEVGPPGSQQMRVQILPLFFREFLADPNKATEWTFKKNNITLMTETEFDFKLHAQYEGIFQPIQVQAPAPVIAPPTSPASGPEVIKLFSED